MNGVEAVAGVLLGLSANRAPWAQIQHAKKADMVPLANLSFILCREIEGKCCDMCLKNRSNKGM